MFDNAEQSGLKETPATQLKVPLRVWVKKTGATAH